MGIVKHGETEQRAVSTSLQPLLDSGIFFFVIRVHNQNWFWWNCIIYCIQYSFPLPTLMLKQFKKPNGKEKSIEGISYEVVDCSHGKQP
nr:hypothetical protein CFP56_72612 [Quercus suber]